VFECQHRLFLGELRVNGATSSILLRHMSPELAPNGYAGAVPACPLSRDERT
jgi:hypothetical protein